MFAELAPKRSKLLSHQIYISKSSADLQLYFWEVNCFKIMLYNALRDLLTF